ncbi:hypothetical protein GCM10023080_094240 [Streptomyces pseudoechinosporeus]
MRRTARALSTTATAVAAAAVLGTAASAAIPVGGPGRVPAGERGKVPVEEPVMVPAEARAMAPAQERAPLPAGEWARAPAEPARGSAQARARVPVEPVMVGAGKRTRIPAEERARVLVGEPVMTRAKEGAKVPVGEPARGPAQEPGMVQAEERAMAPAHERATVPADESATGPARVPEEEPSDPPPIPDEEPSEELAEEPADKWAEESPGVSGEEPADEWAEESAGPPTGASAAAPAAEVSPRTVAPGDTVTVSVSCGVLGGTAPKSIDAHSQAFEHGTAKLHLVKGQDEAAGPAYRGTARIAPASHFKEGGPDKAGPTSEWSVDGTCPAPPGGEEAEWSATFMVSRDGYRHPHGVRAGKGGAFTDSPAALAAGGLLIAGALGAGVHKLLRREPSVNR